MAPNIAIPKKVEDLLGKMTPPEKIGQMVQVSGSGPIPDDLKHRIREGRIGSMLNVTDPGTSMELQRIRLKPQETGTVISDLPACTLGFHDSGSRYVVERGKFRLWVGGDSQASLTAGFEIIG